MYTSANTATNEILSITALPHEGGVLQRGPEFETRIRVRSALQHLNFESHHDYKLEGGEKPGTAADLAYAAAALNAPSENVAYLGEVGLNGSVRPVRGVLKSARKLAEQGITRLVVASDRANPALAWYLRDVGVELFEVDTIRDLLEPFDFPVQPRRVESKYSTHLSELNVSERIETAIQEALDEGKPILFVGPSGTGKTALTRRMFQRMAEMTAQEEAEVAEIFDDVGLFTGVVDARPFRSPHHTIRAASLADECRLARNGVLMLDEISYLKRHVLDTATRAYENGKFVLVGASDGCFCGRDGAECKCTDTSRDQFSRKLDEIEKRLGMVRITLNYEDVKS